MNEIDVFICISNRSKSETDRVIRLRTRGIAPLGAQFFSAYVSLWGKKSFLTINKKTTISLISLKIYSITLHIRAQVFAEFAGRGFKALGGEAFCNIFCLSM